MKYFLCIIGDFDGNETIYDECVERGIYQYHHDTRQKGAVSAIEPGDILILVTHKQIRGYGIAAQASIDVCKGHDGDWCAIKVKDGWRLVTDPYPLPYGVYWNTIPGRGTKQSIVKELMSEWCTEVLLQLKRRRRENVTEYAFPVHVTELAIGFGTTNPFFKIPEIQRGLVWNPVRCEILWDSILRGFPIGAISIRPMDDRWEIFDGQQRTNTIALGFAPWPSNNDNPPILWIDLDPPKTSGRRFVFMVTTPAHPWGYNLSDDEDRDSRIAVWEQKDAVKRIEEQWLRHSVKGAHPYTRELWPTKAHFPVPFSLLRRYIEECSGKREVSFDSFLSYCERNFSNHNWMRFCFSKNETPNLEAWGEIVQAIRQLSDYSVVALNGGGVSPEDLGLYFTRMNTQGMVPDDEEIRYSQLKAILPSLKEMDKLAEKRTRPAWLADLAVRLWQARQSGWKWPQGNMSVAVGNIAPQKADFAKFIKEELPELLNRLDMVLTENEDGLLRWHLGEVYRYGHGSCLALYFLREIYLKHSTDMFVAIATTVLWFGLDIANCAKCLWDASNIQEGLFRAIQKGAMVRVFDIGEVSDWTYKMKERLKQADWGTPQSITANPYMGNALERIWNGFDGRTGCSFLLYVCRKFMNDYFNGYNDSSPEWREQNRPWDYDHILPQVWVGSKRVSGYSYAVRKFLGSIGNSAPLPLSLNRGKNANPPDNYPDGDETSALKLHISWEQVNRFGKDKKRYVRLDKDKKASTNFIIATMERFGRMVTDWYVTCGIERLLDFSYCRDVRRCLFEKLATMMNDSIPSAKAKVWFTNGEYQYKVDKSIDWAREWLACGVCGEITYDGAPQKCMIAVASDGVMLELGIRRHPEMSDMPGDEVWWLAVGEKSTYKDYPRIEDVDISVVLQELKKLILEYNFKVTK